METLIGRLKRKVLFTGAAVALFAGATFGMSATPASAQVIYRVNNNGSTSVDVPSTVLQNLPTVINAVNSVNGRSYYSTYPNYYPSSYYNNGYYNNGYAYPTSTYYPSTYYTTYPTYYQNATYPSRYYYSVPADDYYYYRR